MRAVTERINLQEAYDNMKVPSDSLFAGMAFDEDEWLELRNPLSCPLKYLMENPRDILDMEDLPSDDPRRIEYEKNRQYKSHMWAFANWNIRDDEGESVPSVSVKNDDGWFLLSTAQQIFLLQILADKFYKQPEDSNPVIIVDENDNPLE